MQDARGDGHGVEEAEAHRLVGLRVVPGGSHYREPKPRKERCFKYLLVSLVEVKFTIWLIYIPLFQQKLVFIVTLSPIK